MTNKKGITIAPAWLTIADDADEGDEGAVATDDGAVAAAPVAVATVAAAVVVAGDDAAVVGDAVRWKRPPWKRRLS